MTDIPPISPSHPAAIHGPSRSVPGKSASTQAGRKSDSVEVSQVAQYLSKLQQMPDVRQDLVDRVRSEIAKGNYDTPDKVEALMDELMQDLRE